MLIRRYGRLPVLFWSQARDGGPQSYYLNLLAVQVLALGFLVGCTFAPNLKTFTGQHFYCRLEAHADDLRLLMKPCDA